MVNTLCKSLFYNYVHIRYVMIRGMYFVTDNLHKGLMT